MTRNTPLINTTKNDGNRIVKPSHLETFPIPKDMPQYSNTNNPHPLVIVPEKTDRTLEEGETTFTTFLLTHP